MKSGFLFERRLLWLTFVSVFVGDALISIPIGPYHISLFRLILPIVIILLLTRIVLLKKIKFIVHIKPYLQFLFFWFFYAMISLIWATDKIAAIKQIAFLGVGILLIVLITFYLSDTKSLMRFYYLWLSVLALYVLVGFWEITTGNHLFLSNLANYVNPYPGIASYERIRYMPTAFFHNTNDFATFLSISILLMLVLIKNNQPLGYRALTIGLLLASLFLLQRTESRANFLAVFFGFIFWFLILLKSRAKIIIVISALLLFVVIFIVIPTQVTHFINEIIYGFTSIGATDESTLIRWALVQNSFRAVIATIGFGLGAGNFQNFMTNYVQNRSIFAGGVIDPHNLWIEILANYGIFIFVGFVIVYLRILINLLKVIRVTDNKEQRFLAEAALPGLIGFSVAVIGSSSIFSVNIIWMYLGFTLAIINLHRIAQKEKLECIS